MVEIGEKSMKKTAFLFSGQGAQYTGMGRELYDNYEVVRKTLDSINDIINFDLLNIIFNGPDEVLTETENTQPAILSVSVAFERLLKSAGINADYAAGLSLGEYAALVASGALKFEDALPLVRKRGSFMQEAVPLGVGGMAAIIGLDRETVGNILKEASSFGIVEGANYNCPGQIVISGQIPAVGRAVEIAKDKGAKRAMMLSVSAPFHCSMLKIAGDRLNTELQKVDFGEFGFPVIANVDGEYYPSQRDHIIDRLTRQVMSPVLFEESIRRMIHDGVDTFIELGPGKALSGFVKRIDKNVNIFNVENSSTFKKLVEAYGASNTTVNKEIAC